MTLSNRRSKFVMPASILMAALIGYLAGAQVLAVNRTKGLRGTAGARYAMNVIVSDVPFWEDTRETWRAIEKTGNNTLIFGGPSGNKGTDAQEQIDEIAALLADTTNKLNGLIVTPADSGALVPIINKAVAQGVPVLTYLIDSPSSNRLAYVSSELEGASRKIAEFAAADLDDGGAAGKAVEVAILFAKAGNQEQEARRRGFEQFIAEHRGMRLVKVIEDNYDEKTGAGKVKALLLQHPKLRFIFGCDSRSAIAAISALNEMGIPKGQVIVTGWDVDADVLDGIRAGWIRGSVAQQSSYMTQLMFAALEASHRGYLYPVTRAFRENGVRPLPEEVIVPVAVVTPQNALGFYPKKQ